MASEDGEVSVQHNKTSTKMLHSPTEVNQANRNLGEVSPRKAQLVLFLKKVAILSQGFR